MMGQDELFNENEIPKTRKTLLVLSFIGISFGLIGLEITKVSLLGTEFKTKNPSLIPYILATIILYYLISFVIRYRHMLSERRLEKTKGKLIDNKEYFEKINKKSGDISEGFKKAYVAALNWKFHPKLFYNPDKKETKEQKEENKRSQLREDIQEHLKEINIELNSAIFSLTNAASVVEIITEDEVFSDQEKEEFYGSFGLSGTGTLKIKKEQILEDIAFVRAGHTIMKDKAVYSSRYRSKHYLDFYFPIILALLSIIFLFIPI